MRNAIQVAYPSDRSIIGKLFVPYADWRTYLKVLQLASMAWLGIGYFIFLVVGFSVGGALIWTFPGVAILLVTILASRLIGDIEAKMVSAVTGMEIRRPPWNLEGIEGWRSKLWARLIDPTTWTGIVYLFVQFPLGLAVFVAIVAGGSIAGMFVASPIIVLFTDEPITVLDGGSVEITVSTASEALWLVPIGLLASLVLVHFVLGASALHAAWARLMLGSRARPRPLTGDDRGPRGSDVSEPPQANPPGTEQTTPQPASADVRPFLPGHPAQGPVTASESARREALARFGELTPRESEIVGLITRGFSNAEIAETCVISEGTVKTHVKRIFAKLGLHDRSQVVVFAYESGAISADSSAASDLKAAR